VSRRYGERPEDADTTNTDMTNTDTWTPPPATGPQVGAGPDLTQSTDAVTVLVPGGAGSETVAIGRDGAAFETVALPGNPAAVLETMVLPGPGAAAQTVALPPAPGGAQTRPIDARTLAFAAPPAAEFTGSAFGVNEAPPAVDEAPPAPGTVRWFGPGVPTGAITVPVGAAAVWRGESRPAEPEPRRRDARRWALAAVVLLLVLAVLAAWWLRGRSTVAVSGAAAVASPTTVVCGGTATITGVIQTNGGSGTITYEWKRSDGTVSGDLTQHVAKGTHTVDVALLWTFNGHGDLRPTATLDILSPDPTTAAVRFVYTCP
jgi:hypothetical protein